jgi:dTMP kinase
MEGLERVNSKKLTGRFLALDGPDGCGKTTQLEMLAKYLKNLNIDVIETNDPGGTKIGDQISRLLKYDAQGQMDVRTELMLFMASRAQLVKEIIEPSLELGKTVLCDRFVSSTCAYQGSSGYPVNKIIEFAKFAIGDTWPDLTIVIDISPEEGLLRTGRKPRQKTKVNHEDADQHYLFKNVVVDRFDSRTLEYHRKVRSEFLKLPDYYPKPVRIIDGSTGNIESIHERIKEVVIRTLDS